MPSATGRAAPGPPRPWAGDPPGTPAAGPWGRAASTGALRGGLPPQGPTPRRRPRPGLESPPKCQLPGAGTRPRCWHRRGPRPALPALGTVHKSTFRCKPTRDPGSPFSTHPPGSLPDPGLGAFLSPHCLQLLHVFPSRWGWTATGGPWGGPCPAPTPLLSCENENGPGTTGGRETGREPDPRPSCRRREVSAALHSLRCSKPSAAPHLPSQVRTRSSDTGCDGGDGQTVVGGTEWAWGGGWAPHPLLSPPPMALRPSPWQAAASGGDTGSLRHPLGAWPRARGLQGVNKGTPPPHLGIQGFTPLFVPC
ncbi:basic proline-rich protein-like [Choloepus didactylus]|uniref:basic proline-rich protein-like n=1 Tax=Choloepus didactylus TaxID=27675 RepID=UPI00189F9FA2|nr:basic proline-rich protein-like [Choloepus didactylus]XP_037671697.1 basic proline-rich protein-like [Choloepus didactylus]XP_037671698.1 basic proline-rich protein-like [Choloepus didactylus]